MNVKKYGTLAITLVCVVALAAVYAAVNSVVTSTGSGNSHFPSGNSLNNAGPRFPGNMTNGHGPGFAGNMTKGPGAGFPGNMTPPSLPNGGQGGFCDTTHMSGIVSTLQKAGYDTTELTSLITAGDCSKVTAWLDTFNAAYPGVLPTPGQGPGGNGQPPA